MARAIRCLKPPRDRTARAVPLKPFILLRKNPSRRRDEPRLVDERGPNLHRRPKTDDLRSPDTLRLPLEFRPKARAASALKSARACTRVRLFRDPATRPSRRSLSAQPVRSHALSRSVIRRRDNLFFDRFFRYLIRLLIRRSVVVEGEP